MYLRVGRSFVRSFVLISLIDYKYVPNVGRERIELMHDKSISITLFNSVNGKEEAKPSIYHVVAFEFNIAFELIRTANSIW